MSHEANIKYPGFVGSFESASKEFKNYNKEIKPLEK